MAAESVLTATLQTVCPRVFPDFAPVSTAKPYVTYQFIGGQSLYYLNNTPANRRHHRVQVNVWATTRLQANQLAREVEEAIRLQLSGTPDSEPLGGYDEGNEVRGTVQDFTFYTDR